MAHDRFLEAHYFLHQMEKNYHEPQLFRYNFHAFVSAARAVHEMLQNELEKLGEIQWWKQRKVEFTSDEVLKRFTKGRNVALHQRNLIEGGSVQLGLFRGRRMKLAMLSDIKSDEPSANLLRRITPHFYDFLIDEEHSAYAEQVGLERLYFVKELSDNEDVLRASRRALARTTRVLAEVHNKFGAEHVPIEDHDLLAPEDLQAIMTLLETDLDPEAAARWGWLDPDPADETEQDDE